MHPGCYRRDLFGQDVDDDSPWYCSRCKYIISMHKESQLMNGNTALSKVTLPICFLCNDLSGAMVDLETNEWVHHTCINWHNEVWFETDDAALNNFSGTLDYSRFDKECSICKVKQGSCISCDYKGCNKYFHVRCAMKQKFILSHCEMEANLKVGDWDIKVYCQTHQNKGKIRVKQIKQINLCESGRSSSKTKNIVLSEEEDSRMNRPKAETRLAFSRKNFYQNQKKRESILEQINIDRILNDEKSMTELPSQLAPTVPQLKGSVGECASGKMVQG